ncbi:DUF4062 domain-containing protein [Pantoea eucrina]|uniref:DUF4062 domain-containing protein n=1 Tax=Pantoea eucrina TaxID=472693 RepID=UPI003CF729FA
MDKRYQVFVSSTFADLEDERKHVIQTLMEMDCIPAGMELFPAIDEEQWEFIKKVIDDCDYYLLIIGGRYGSVAEDGLSYTEKEFDYAVEKGLKVTVLLHDDPESLPARKTESVPESREKLLRFIEKVQTGRLRRTWKSAEELPGLVALSMTKTMKTYPAIGWVRADKVSKEDNLNELITAKNEIANLKKIISQYEEAQPQSIYGDDIAGLDNDFTIRFSLFSHQSLSNDLGKSITFNIGEIFKYISPIIDEGTPESSVAKVISEMITYTVSDGGESATIYNEDLITLRMHFLALGLISYNNGWWSLTSEGQEEMIKRRVIRK